MKTCRFHIFFVCTLFVCGATTIFAQEKLTSFLGGIKYASLQRALTFNHKMYVFESIDYNEFVIWRYDFLTGDKEEFYRENPVTGVTLWSAFVFGSKLYYCAGNKMFEINTSDEIKEVFSIDDEKVRDGIPAGDKLYILTTGNLIWDVFDLYAFDTMTNEVLYKVEDHDVGQCIFDLPSLYNRTIPEERIPMVEKDSIPGLYSYSVEDQQIRNLEGANELLGQSLQHLTQFRKDEYYFIDTLQQIWYTDLAMNIAMPIFKIQDGFDFDKFSIKKNMLLTLATREVSSDTTHYIVYRFQYDINQLDTLDLSNQPTFDIISLEANGVFAVTDSTYGFLDFSDTGFHFIVNIPDFENAYLIEQPQSENFTIRVSRSFNGNLKCLYKTDRNTLETHLVDCDPLTYNFTQTLFEGDSLFIFSEHRTEGTKCFRVGDDKLEEKFDLYKGYQGRNYELYAFDHTLIGSDRNGLAFQINPTVQQIELEGGSGFLSLERDWFSYDDDIYFQDQTGYKYLRRFPKNGTYAEIVHLYWKYPYPIRVEEYDPPFYSINGRIISTVFMNSKRHLCELNPETGELDCLVDTMDLSQFLAGEPVFALGDSICTWIKTKEYGREPWIISRNKANSFLLKEYHASGDSYLTNYVQGEGRSLFQGTFIGGTIRSDGTPSGTFKVSNKIPLWYKGDEFYLIRSVTGSDEIVKSNCNSLEVEHLAFAKHIDKTYVRGDTLFYIDTDDQLYYWTTGMEEPVYIMDITTTALSDIYAGHGIIFIVKGITDPSLIASDGTEGNHAILVEHVGLSDEIHSYLVVGDKMIFSHYDPDYGLELWITNGTIPGTKMLYDIMPGSANSEPLILKEHDGFIYFSALDENEGRQLFRIAKTDLTDITVTHPLQPVAVKIFPNPTSGLLHIENLPEMGPNEISIYSLSGNLCFLKKSSINEEYMDLSGLPEGLYILYIKNKTQRSIYKIMNAR